MVHAFARLLIPLLAVAFTACAREAPPLVLRARVTAVIDGDTIDVNLDSGPERIRLHGIDAPEAEAPFGREATRSLRDLLAGATVEVEPVADDPRDTYDRLLAVVYADGVDVNAALVTQGHAWAYRRYLGEVEDGARLCDLEAAARDARKGLWSQPSQRWVPPWIYRARQRAGPGARVPSRDYAGETAAACRAAIGEREEALAGRSALLSPPVAPSGQHQPGCDIKGNINAEGVRIYHVPGSEHYARTRIDTARGERWFCSEAEARAAGWRAARPAR